MVSATAKTDYERIITLIGRMEFKRRQTCPGPKLSKVAFGIGRRVPIVKATSNPRTPSMITRGAGVPLHLEAATGSH